MRRILAGMGIAMLALAPMQAMAQAGGGDEELGTHIRMGERGPKPPKPIAREKLDKAVAKMFASADGNRDGVITLAEINGAIDALKDRTIRERFDAIDSDHDKQLSLAEFAQWQRAMGSAVLSDSRSGGRIDALVAEELPLDLGRDREDEVLAQVIEPLSATVIVEANTNYDEGASLEELTAYERQKFDAADLNKDGWLTFDEVDRLEHPDGARGPGGPGAPPRGG